jgi:hypothetical protein
VTADDRLPWGGGLLLIFIAICRGLASDFEDEDEHDIFDEFLDCRHRSDAGPEFAIEDFVPLL